MKKLLNLWLMVALMCGLGMSVTSCKDDDKNENQSGGQTEEQSDKDMADAVTFWGVVGQLSDTPMPNDWKNATYEPSIGVPDGTNNAIRIVSCADEESAAARAADLLGADITTETASYTYQNDIVGKLTYRKTGGSSLAIVDVSIPKMPGLSQIVYKTPEQMGQNASFQGTAYYRFGDVVVKTNSNGDLDYWVCIRPSFNPAGKGESHWISVSKLPKENVDSSKTLMLNGVKVRHKIPKSLVSSQEYLVDLAELLYAMTDAKQWAFNLVKDDGYKKLKYLWDFDFKKRFEYHDHHYFDKLGEEWEKYGLFKKIFGLNREEMKQHLATKGLSMLWQSGSVSGNDVTLKVTRYDGMNLKTKNDFKTTSRWENKAFDINALIGNKGYIDDPVIVGADNRYWVVRYASGATLAKGNESGGYDVHKRMPNCDDIFLYNEIVEKNSMTVEALKAKEPSSYLDGVCENRSFYLIGGVLLDKNGHRWICMQSVPNNRQEMGYDYTGTYNYAYFVSYEKGAVGEQLNNVPKKQLAMQILFSMEVMYQNLVMFWHNPDNEQMQIRKNILNWADVDLGEILAKRDTLFKFKDEAKAGQIPCTVASTVFKENNKLYVLRLLADYTAAQESGARDWSWHFFDVYTNDMKSRMELYDLSIQSNINTFKIDKWVYQPWADITLAGQPPKYTVTTGPRTDTEDLSDLSRLIYQRGRSYLDGTVPFDMYRDPLVPFAVKRVKETKKPATSFDDNTPFVHWGRLYFMYPDRYSNDYTFSDAPIATYETYQHQQWFNEKQFHWGMSNAVK